MDLIYPVSYLICLSGLVLWFFFQGNKKLSRKMSAVFLSAFLIYLAALSLSSGQLSYKLLILVRDMVVLGIVTQLFNVFQKSILASVGLGILAAGIVYFAYFKTLDLTFPQIAIEQLDSSGELLVEIKSGREDILDQIRKRYPCTIERAFRPADESRTDLDAYYIVDILSERKRVIKSCYDWLYGSPDIAWVEPNEKMLLLLPEENLPVQGNAQKHFVDDPEIGKQWGFVPMHADQLHQAILESGLKPRRTARVVIIDTGIDATHEDIRQNYHSINKEYDTDPKGHGTHCAGIAAAVSNNGIGIASIAPGPGFVEVSSIRALNALGAGTQEELIKAMIIAVDQGADVLSLSLGGESTHRKQKAYEDAVKYASDHGAIVVVAAGNSNSNAKKASPANVKGVITVSAIDQDSRKATFSNTVEDIDMALAAPGVGIYSTLPGNKYGALNGTSMATPYVSGLIGLLKSFNPELSTRDVYRILKETGLETKDGQKTGPLIQPLKALEKVVD
jgi:thermitase